MRADRLLSLLMLLQTRGQMTAESLAEQLEVSVRTVYRDMDALSFAGVPVTCRRGPGGGCALLDSYRSNLTGLNRAEVRALFMLSIPASLNQLGLGRELKSALLKLSAALPPSRRQDPVWIRQRIYLDWSGSQAVSAYPACLTSLQNAIWADRCLNLRYRLVHRSYNQTFEQRVEPLGLVVSSGSWYLVATADRHRRVYSAASILSVDALESTFARPADFDLASFWTRWYERHRLAGPEYRVSVRVSSALANELPWWLGSATRAAGDQQPPPDDEGWLRLRLSFPSLETARTELLGCGAAVEVLAPEALRLSLLDYARQIVERCSC
jgi:predicted DNA-binding transcriptional regulator YafY